MTSLRESLALQPDLTQSLYTRLSKTLHDELGEAAFQAWYKKWAEKIGLNPNPDDPRHMYDYRAAWRAGVEPEPDPSDENRYHWPSTFKADQHPTRFQMREGRFYDTKHERFVSPK